MHAEAPAVESIAEDLERESLYRFLSAVVAGPFSPAWALALGDINQELALAAAESLGMDDAGFVELIDALRCPAEELRADHDRVFGLVVPKECPPYEAEYYPTSEVFARSQQMADVAGFYRAFGVATSGAAPERPDHLATELEFMAFLLTKKRLAQAEVADDPDAAERVEVCDGAHRDFWRDHLAWWLPSFAAGLARKAEGRGYPATLARVLAAWVPSECARFCVSAVLRPARPELIERPEEQSGCASCPLNS